MSLSPSSILAALSVSLALPVLPQSPCDQTGVVFVADPVDGSLMVKMERSNEIDTVRFSATTQAFRVGADDKPMGSFDPKTIQSGDRVCIHVGANPQNGVAKILVLTRPDIQKQQQQEIGALKQSSAFGVITSIDSDKHTIQLNESFGDSNSKTVEVSAGNSTILRKYSHDSVDAADGKAFAWKQLWAGDQIYVQGVRTAESPAIHAEMILSGGVRGVFGTVVAINGLDETLDVQEKGSAHLTTIRIRPQGLFEISGPALHEILFADLRQGDSVAALGWSTENPHELRGLIAVTTLGTFAPLPSEAPPVWLLDSPPHVH